MRNSILKAIGELGDKGVVPRLIEMLDNKEIDLDVRGSIVEAIGELGNEEVARGLIKKLGDKEIDLDVRGSIAKAIGKLGNKEVVPCLVKILDGDQGLHQYVRSRIEKAIDALNG